MKKTIFIADDDSSILDVMRILLEEEGYTVQTTTNGQKAKALEEPLPDLLLLDIWMSGITGKEVCMFLKSQERTKRIPIILVSANRDTALIAQEASADDFILKPFDIEELLRKVKKYLGNKR